MHYSHLGDIRLNGNLTSDNNKGKQLRVIACFISPQSNLSSQVFLLAPFCRGGLYDLGKLVDIKLGCEYM